jgi:hypothetical protein
MEADVHHGNEYETVAVSVTDQVLGNTGARGDLLVRVIVTVATAATSTCSIKDGAAGAVIPLLAANAALGAYSIELNLRATTVANPGWRITTGAGATAIATGRFT